MTVGTVGDSREIVLKGWSRYTVEDDTITNFSNHWTVLHHGKNYTLGQEQVDQLAWILGYDEEAKN